MQGTAACSSSAAQLAISHLHQVAGSAGAIAGSHLTPLILCVCDCRVQLQAATAAAQSDLHQADIAADAFVEFHLTLSSCVFVNEGHSCKQQQQQHNTARRSSLQRHKLASRHSVQLLRWGRSTGLPPRPRPRLRSCRARWQSSRWLAGQKKPKGLSNKPKSEHAGVLEL